MGDKLGKAVDAYSGIHYNDYTNICGVVSCSYGRYMHETHCSRDASSEGRVVKGRAVQGTHCQRDGTSKSFCSGTVWLWNGHIVLSSF